MRRVLLLVTTLTLMMLAAMMALSKRSLAQGEVCVRIKGQTKVDRGASGCSSDSTFQAVAVNGSIADAHNDSQATAVNDSTAGASSDCTATAQNGEVEICS